MNLNDFKVCDLDEDELKEKGFKNVLLNEKKFNRELKKLSGYKRIIADYSEELDLDAIKEKYEYVNLARLGHVIQ